LYYAAKKGYLDMCKALIERGCDVTHHDSHNKTAVEYARRARYHEVTEYLANEVKKARELKTQQIAK
jgi:ankyrin repeat protein